MDPNAALANLREAITDYEASEDGATEERDAANRMRDFAEALDEWLSKGGFLPEAWTR